MVRPGYNSYVACLVGCISRGETMGYILPTLWHCLSENVLECRDYNLAAQWCRDSLKRQLECLMRVWYLRQYGSKAGIMVTGAYEINGDFGTFACC
jgi:hypothetical protein